MAVITLGSPNFDPTPLLTSVTTVNSPAIEVVNGGSMTAMVGETDPIFTAWDRHTGITIHPSQIVLDTADIVPLGLALSSQGLTAGTQLAYVVLTWTAISSSTFAYYKVRYKRNAFSTYSYVDSYTNTISIEGLVANTVYNFGIASINSSGISSAFSTDINVTTTADTTQPATVTGLTATAGIQLVVLTWTANTDADIASYNIYRKTTDDSSTSVLIGNVSGTYFVDGGLPDSQIQYYWLKAKDTSGNISAAYSTGASATPRDVLGIDTLGGLIGANLLNVAAINPITGEINENKIGTLQLADNAVTAANILDGEITALKTSIAAINATTGEINENKVGALQIQPLAITAAEIANDAITAAALAPDSVTGPAILAGSILAGHITAGEIQTAHLAAGAVTAAKITTANFVLSAGTFTSNTPTDSISWADCVVVYNGIEYTITDGTCTVGDNHIYWEYEGTTFSHSVALPALGDNDFLVAYNDAGTYLLVWNSTVINGNRITTGSISATQIAANAITANHILAGTITTNHINATGISATKLVLTNFLLVSGTITISATHIIWTDCVIRYSGTTYTISPNNSCLLADKFVYWQLADPTVFKYSPTLPDLDNDDFLVAVYYATPAPHLVHTWKATVVNGNRITAGSIVGSTLAAGTITANEIATDAITADKILAGSITAGKIATGAITTAQLDFTPVESSSIIASINASTEGGGALNISAAKIAISGDCTFSGGYDPSGKTGTFKQGAIPTSVSIGDIWIDTDDKNKMYYAASVGATTIAEGAWELSRDILVTDLNTSMDSLNNDDILSMSEKPSIKGSYDAIIKEQVSLDAKADIFSVSRVAYDAAILILTNYLAALTPAYSNFDADTTLVSGAAFRKLFVDVYDERAALLTNLSAAAGTWFETTIGAGWITTGRIEVGQGASGNAGITGASALSDAVRFWAGADHANKATAPFRVQDDGVVIASSGEIGGWNIDTDAIYTGTKHTENGLNDEVAITLCNDGSIHAKNFYIDADGEVSFKATAPEIDGVKTLCINVGGWDMDADLMIYLDTGLSVITYQLVSVSILIYNDNEIDATVLDLPNGSWTVTEGITNKYLLTLYRTASPGVFDSTDYDDSLINRGYVVLSYINRI